MKLADSGQQSFASEIDDNLKIETYHHVEWPVCIGSTCAYGTPVIKTIAKPAFPVMVR
jgi:hypothetical protein